MGKPDEALSVSLNAKELLYSDNIFHFDDLTLSTLQIVFQRLDRCAFVLVHLFYPFNIITVVHISNFSHDHANAVDLATSCYEYACTKYPSNLELMMGLFNCYVREYSYVKQQQV